MYRIKNGKNVEATGDTPEEALWELKRNRPGDLFYPRHASLDSNQIIGVDVRPKDDEMTVIEMTMEEVA